MSSDHTKAPAPANRKKHTDINLSGIWAHVPQHWHPYITLCRLDRPVGVFLLFWPCIWGLCLGAFPHLPNFSDLLLFFFGALLMRSAGCVINDLADRKFDGKVERTAARPLVSGALTAQQAYGTLAVLLGLAFLILVQYPLHTIIVGLSSMGLVVAYPFMKRITYWPQLFLGLTFNWGVILGYAVYQNTFSWPVLLVYASSILWTLAYDTIYAHQDKEDDLLIGVKSAALKLGPRTANFVKGCYILQFSLLLYAGVVGQLTWLFGACALAAFLLHLKGLRHLNYDNPTQTLKAFKHHILTGAVISLGFLAN